MPDGPTSAKDTRSVVEALLRAWIAFDVDGVIATIAEDCVYALHLDEGVFPLAGETIGREAIRATLLGFRTKLDYRLWRPMHLVVEGEMARNQLEFLYRDRATGEEISGRCRFVWRVVDGFIVRCDEYHDAKRLEAFFRIVARAPAGPPELSGGEAGPAASPARKDQPT